MLFPYLDGVMFAADLFRAGGTSLIDRAFAHPPRSTEQVLHPDKYILGELPIPVAPLTPPDGWKTVTTGTMGELQTSVLLAQCLPVARANAAAAGWGGDAYAIAWAAAKPAPLGSPAWPADAAAVRFEEALRARDDCLAERAPETAPQAVVVRDGTHVAYVQGMPEDAGGPLARSLLALPGARPPDAPPLGPVTIPPLVVPEDAFAHDGRYEGRRWRSPSLGMTISVPDGFEPADNVGSFEALMRHETTGSVAGFDVLMDRPGERLERAYLRTAMRGLRKNKGFHWQQLQYVGEDRLAVDDTAAHTYEWRVYGGHVLIGFVPACEGRATVVLFLVWPEQAGRAVNRWLDVFHLPDDDSPACTYLERARD
jgi:hypothetical protein